MIKKRRTYLPRIVGDKVMMPADLKRLHKYMLEVVSASALFLTRCARWSKASGPNWRTSCHRRGREAELKKAPGVPGPPVASWRSPERL